MSEPNTSATVDPREVVDALLHAAGLDVPAEETDRLAALYPGLRRSVDRFYQVDTADEVPAAVFEAGSASDTGSTPAGPVRAARVDRP